MKVRHLASFIIIKSLKLACSDVVLPQNILFHLPPHLPPLPNPPKLRTFPEAQKRKLLLPQAWTRPHSATGGKISEPLTAAPGHLELEEEEEQVSLRFGGPELLRPAPDLSVSERAGMVRSGGAPGRTSTGRQTLQMSDQRELGPPAHALTSLSRVEAETSDTGPQSQRLLGSLLCHIASRGWGEDAKLTFLLTIYLIGIPPT